MNLNQSWKKNVKTSSKMSGETKSQTYTLFDQFEEPQCIFGCIIPSHRKDIPRKLAPQSTKRLLLSRCRKRKGRWWRGCRWSSRGGRWRWRWRWRRWGWRKRRTGTCARSSSSSLNQSSIAPKKLSRFIVMSTLKFQFCKREKAINMRILNLVTHTEDKEGSQRSHQ